MAKGELPGSLPESFPGRVNHMTSISGGYSANDGIPISAQVDRGIGSTRIKTYTPLQLWALWRASYLDKRRIEYMEDPESEEWKKRLLNKAAYSTFRDCVDAGVGAEARQLLKLPEQKRTGLMKLHG
ncbi:hypothetical protein HYS97_02555 [Candidatus Daviesbacteria bacterium]|nr:hypothetical protein [Candidatus Daviesbacteria bacterium]